MDKRESPAWGSDKTVRPVSPELRTFLDDILNQPPAERDGSYERRQLEWLASFSTRHARQLRDVQLREAKAEADRRLLAWLADISAKHRYALQRLAPVDATQGQDDSSGFDSSPGAIIEWNPALHPRAGGPPNAGWFAPAGGNAKGGSEASHEQLAQAPTPGPGPAGSTRVRFGEWRDRPAGFPLRGVRENGMRGRNHGRVHNAISKLQERKVGEVFDKHGVVISLDKDDQEMRAIEAKRGRALPPNTQAAYDSRMGVIHVFDKTKTGPNRVQVVSRPAHNLNHEAGHVIDHYLGDASNRPDFKAAFERDKAAAGNLANLPADEQHVFSRPQEAYAEAFARKFEDSPPGTLRHSVDYMKNNPDVQRLSEPRS